MYKRKKTNRQTADVTKKKQESSFAFYTQKKTNCFIHTRTHTDIDIFTRKLFYFFSLINFIDSRMYHVVHYHYCYALHSPLESYRFDDHCHDHYHDHVIDVVLNLDDRVMYDDQDGVQLNVNEFDLEAVIEFIFNKRKNIIHTAFMFTTFTSSTICNTENNYNKRLRNFSFVDLPRDLDRRFRSREGDRRRSSPAPLRLLPGRPPRRVEPRPPPIQNTIHNNY
jgi:hypothetical protein